MQCTESKVKCDRQQPCSKCITRGKECVFPGPRRRMQTSVVSENADGVTSTVVQDGLVAMPSALGVSSSAYSAGSDYNSLTSDTVTETEWDGTPASSHLSSLYNNDIFESLFTDIFSTSPLSGSEHTLVMEDTSWSASKHRSDSPEDDFPFLSSTTPEVVHYQPGDDVPHYIASFHVPDLPNGSPLEIGSPDISCVPPDAELQHYSKSHVCMLLALLTDARQSTFSSPLS